MISTVLLGTLIGITGCSGGGSSSPANGSTPSGSSSVSLQGAGSTFVDPAMETWMYDYHKANSSVTLTYSAVGSGAGISTFEKGSVDFGCTDAPLADADLASSPIKMVQFPIVSGCEAISYNIPGYTGHLKFTPTLLADIFMTKVKNWNDPEIAAANPGVTLPNLPIVVVHRTDASGTNFIFTNYLSNVSPEWKAKYGVGKTVNWPEGTVGGQGNQGVAANIQHQQGAVGYVEYAYVVTSKMNYGLVQNKSGQFLPPSVDGTTAAANAAADALAKDDRTPIVNGVGPTVYPIAGFTYALLPIEPKDKAKMAEVVKFMTYAITDGQKTAEAKSYGPLPDSIVKVDQEQIAKIHLK